MTTSIKQLHTNMASLYLAKIKQTKRADDDLIIKIRHAIENMSQEQAHEHIKATEYILGFTAFFVGGLLCAIRDQEWSKNCNYPGFYQFIESEFSITESIANDYMHTYDEMIESDISAIH